MASYIISSGTTDDLYYISGGDTLQVVNSGVASNTTIFGGTAYVSAGGSGANITVVSGGQLYLGPSGGQLERTSVASGGTFFMNGGNASQTSLVGTSAKMFLNEGIANVVYVGASKSRLEMSGGILSSATVGNSNATSNLSALIKVSGGNILNTEVRSGGTVWMTGGAASSASIRKGGYWSMDGGRMSSAIVDKGGSVLIANAKADSVFVSGDYSNSSGGTMTVANGGILTCASAHCYGTVRVNSGGSASNVSLALGGTLEVNGGTAENVSATDWNVGIVNVKNGGIVSNLLFSNTFNGHNGAVLNVSTGGSASSGKIIEQANVYFGGKVTELNIYSAGVLTLYGGTATSTNVMISGHLNVSGGLALNTELSPLVNGIVNSYNDIYGKPAYMDVFADGSALNTVVSKGGSLTVQGTATDTTVSSGGFATVLSTGIASNFIVEWGGEGDVWSGARVSGGTVSGGRLEVTAGGTAENVVVRGGNGSVGKLIVGSDGFVSGTTAGAAGSLSILDGATAVNILASFGTVHVSNGGWLSHTEVSSGWLHVNSGGLALDTIVHENGRLIVEEGGVMSSATVEAGGFCEVSSGGIVESLTVASGGTALLSSGSIIGGPLVLNGGTVTFDLTQLAGPDDKPLVTNFDQITGTPNYRALVGPDQAQGTYILADRAAGFAGNITVEGTSYGDLGSISAGQSLKYENQYYGLSLDGSDLLMTVSAPSDIFLTIAGEFATNGIGDELNMFADGSIRLQSLSDPAGTTVGNLDPVQWELVGALDFDGDGLDELAFKDTLTGNVFLADDPASGISEGKLLSGVCLGQLGQGYSFFGGGSFDGKSGRNDILMKGPSFGDPTLSLNYGLPVWVYDGGVKQYDGWLGALVNTWQSGAPLKGDTTDPADINAKNYQYDLIGIGDFNGDGRSDVMLQNTMPSSVAGKTITGAGDVFVFLTGDEAAVQAGAAPTVCYTGKVDAVDLDGWCVAGIGDFNGDYTDDVLLLNITTGDAACWLMHNGQMQSASGLGTLSADQKIAGIWDVDGDGDDDVILAGSTVHSAWIIENGCCVSTQLLA